MKKYVKDYHYKYYTGNLLTKMWWFDIKTPATGRIMIDFSTHKQLFPNEHGSCNSSYTYDSWGNRVPIGNNNKLTFVNYCCLPTFIQAFSFECKKWGKITMENISDINFDDNSYDQLVLDETKKSILKALILNSKYSFTDIISGKSGGCIFLLHGTPGTEKL